MRPSRIETRDYQNSSFHPLTAGTLNANVDSVKRFLPEKERAAWNLTPCSPLLLP